MTLQQLKDQVSEIITNLRDHATYPKENDLVDYKMRINVVTGDQPVETFLKALAKDCISYANGQGGILLVGIEEKPDGTINDTGLPADNLALFSQIDLNAVTQKFKRITGVSYAIDVQTFTIGTRHFAYVLIPKSSDVLVPKSDFPDYRIKAGEITYRKASTNIHANKDSSDFNNFIQVKANEKSKEFMEIWSKIFPEIVDINPKEVLIVNPRSNQVYGYNSKENNLSGGPIEIEQSTEGVFNIVLNAISAGDIGKITDDEGKPIYKLVGELYRDKPHITMTSLRDGVLELANFRFTDVQLKVAIHYLGWVNVPNFPIKAPPEGTILPGHGKYLWVETTDHRAGRNKIFFSPAAIDQLVPIVNDESLHERLFGKALSPVNKPVEAPVASSPMTSAPAAAPPPTKVKKANAQNPKQKPTKN